MGGVGHWQAPPGKLVSEQVSPLAHAFEEDWMQPFTVAHVTSVVPEESQYAPAPAWQAATVGQAQVPVAGAQACGAVQATVLVTTRQPLTMPQVMAVAPSVEQVFPGPAAQAAGTCGQAQAALGSAPVQVVGDAHDVLLSEARQPFPSRPHFSSLPAEQSVPAVLHSAGGVGQEPQAATPAVTVQGCEQVEVPVTTRQPAASSPQLTTDLLLLGSQNVPGPLQAAGLAGHWQAALGKAVPHGSFEPHASVV